MQNSRVCIRQTGENQVAIDFSGAATRLASQDNPIGSRYLHTMESLGFEPAEPQPDSWVTYHGSVEQVRTNAAALQDQLDAVAGYGAVHDSGFHKSRSGILGKSISRGALRNVLDLPDNASLMVTAGAITAPSADAATDDTLYMYYDRIPYWRGDKKGVVGEDGKTLRPFSAKDIGGLLIGPDGLEAREYFRFSLALGRQTLYRLQLLSKARGTTMGEENRQAFHDFVSDPDRPVVTPMSVPRARTNLQVAYPRIDLEALYDIEAEPKFKCSDAMRLALERYLQKVAEDPELMDKMHAEHQRRISNEI